MTKKEWIQYYQNLLTENIIQSFQEAFKELDTPAKILETLKSEILEGNLGDLELLQSLQLDENGNFIMPLYNPITTQKIQQMMLSVFRHRITQQKIKGGQLIQVTSFGLDESLKIKWQTNEKGEKSVAYAECLMPAWSREFFEAAADPNTGLVDINKIPDELKYMVGARIPTEGLCSMLPLKVVGFLPQQNGSAIMLPQEITTIAGSDFDVDKLFVMMHEFTVQRYNMNAAHHDFEIERKQLQGTSQLLNAILGTDEGGTSDELADTKKLTKEEFEEAKKTTFVTTAPYFSTKATKENTDALVKKEQARFLSAAKNLSKTMGIKIVNVNFNIGGYLGKREISYTFEVEKTDQEKLDLFGSLVSDLAFEVQDSTITGQYVSQDSKDFNAIEYFIECDTQNKHDIADIIEKLGFEAYTITPNGIQILYFDYDTQDTIKDLERRDLLTMKDGEPQYDENKLTEDEKKKIHAHDILKERVLSLQKKIGGTLTTQQMQSNLINRDGKKELYNKALNNLKEKEKSYGKSTTVERASEVHEGASRSEVREQDRKLRLYIEEAIRAIDKSREGEYKEKGYLSQAGVAPLLRMGEETPETLSSSSPLDSYDTYEEYSEAYDSARKRKDKAFNDWFAQHKEEYKLKRPILRKVKVDWSKDPKDMSRAERNNAILDMMRGVLTAPYAAKLLFQPQGYQAHKTASRLLSVLRQCTTEKLNKLLEDAGIKVKDEAHPAETLDTLSFEQLDALKESLEGNMSILMPSTQLYYQQQNMVGIDMVGIYATSNVGHSLFQKLPDLKIPYKIEFLGHEAQSLSRIRSFDGEYISKYVGGYGGASTDSAKDPILMELLQSKKTSPTTMLMLQLGFNPKEIGLFFNQPIIQEVIALTQEGVDYQQSIGQAIAQVKEDWDINPDNEGSFNYTTISETDLLNHITRGNDHMEEDGTHATTDNSEEGNKYLNDQCALILLLEELQPAAGARCD